MPCRAARGRDGPMARAAPRLSLPVTRQGQRLVRAPGRGGALAAGAPAPGPSPGSSDAGEGAGARSDSAASGRRVSWRPWPLSVSGLGAECTSPQAPLISSASGAYHTARGPCGIASRTHDVPRLSVLFRAPEVRSGTEHWHSERGLAFQGLTPEERSNAPTVTEPCSLHL